MAQIRTTLVAQDKWGEEMLTDTSAYIKLHVLGYLYKRMPSAARALLHEVTKARNAQHRRPLPRR